MEFERSDKVLVYSGVLRGMRRVMGEKEPMITHFEDWEDVFKQDAFGGKIRELTQRLLEAYRKTDAAELVQSRWARIMGEIPGLFGGGGCNGQ